LSGQQLSYRKLHSPLGRAWRRPGQEIIAYSQKSASQKIWLEADLVRWQHSSPATLATRRNTFVTFPATNLLSGLSSHTAMPVEVAQQSQRRASFDKPPNPDSSACGPVPAPKLWLGSYPSHGGFVLGYFRTWSNLCAQAGCARVFFGFVVVRSCNSLRDRESERKNLAPRASADSNRNEVSQKVTNDQADRSRPFTWFRSTQPGAQICPRLRIRYSNACLLTRNFVAASFIGPSLSMSNCFPRNISSIKARGISSSEAN